MLGLGLGLGLVVVRIDYLLYLRIHKIDVLSAGGDRLTCGCSDTQQQRSLSSVRFDKPLQRPIQVRIRPGPGRRHGSAVEQYPAQEPSGARPEEAFLGIALGRGYLVDNNGEMGCALRSFQKVVGGPRSRIGDCARKLDETMTRGKGAGC